MKTLGFCTNQALHPALRINGLMSPLQTKNRRMKHEARGERAYSERPFWRPRHHSSLYPGKQTPVAETNDSTRLQLSQSKSSQHRVVGKRVRAAAQRAMAPCRRSGPMDSSTSKGAHGEEIQDGSIGASSVRAPPFLFQSRNAAWSSPKRRWPPCCGWLASEIGIRACGLSSNSGAATSSKSNKRLIRGAQAIADTGFGQNISRTFGIGLDLLPELPNINAQILCVRQRIP